MQLVPESVEKALASPMRSPLLFVLFQQNCEVSSVVDRELAWVVSRASDPSSSPALLLKSFQLSAACLLSLISVSATTRTRTTQYF